MSGLLTTLLIGGLIIGGAVILINPDNRCNYLGLCGQGAAAAPVTEPIVETTTGTIEAPAEETAASSGSTDRKSKGCCVCEMQGDRVKCQKSGTGVWFNPPAGSGGSNDQSVDLSLEECNKDCGSTASTPIKATGSVKAGAGAGGNKSSGGGSSSNKSSGGSSAGSGARVSGGASIPKAAPKKSSVVGSGQKISDAKIKAAWAGYTQMGHDNYYQVPQTQSYYSSNRFLYPDYPRIRGGRIYLY